MWHEAFSFAAVCQKQGEASTVAPSATIGTDVLPRSKKEGRTILASPSLDSVRDRIAKGAFKRVPGKGTENYQEAGGQKGEAELEAAQHILSFAGFDAVRGGFRLCACGARHQSRMSAGNQRFILDGANPGAATWENA
jgi:hypothetical protein